MKYTVAPANYSFNASAKTITFSGLVPSDISNILHVANITRGVIYFQPQAGLTFSGTYASPVLTLTADTTGHTNSDKLLIVYDDASGIQAVTDNNSSLTVDGKAYNVTLDITRPANTTAYSAGDVIGTGSGDAAILTLASIGPSGGYVLVQSIELVLGISAVPSGMTSFRLHFYNAAPAAAADNSVFDLTSGDRAKYLGYVDLPAPIDFGSTCFTQVDYPGKLFKLASANTSLFCELQTIGGFTPAANSEVYSLRVKTLEAGL
jgi:hypothetical protein